MYICVHEVGGLLVRRQLGEGRVAGGAGVAILVDGGAGHVPADDAPDDLHRLVGHLSLPRTNDTNASNSNIY